MWRFATRFHKYMWRFATRFLKYIWSDKVGGDIVAHSSSSIVAQAVEGAHVLKIVGYSRTKGLDNGKFISSNTFEIGGLLWAIKYYPDGARKEDAGWISLYLGLHRSNATDSEARLMFSLVDDFGEPVRLFSERTTSCVFKPGTIWGFPKFIQKTALEKSKHLKEDSFTVRCDVTVSKEIRIEGSSTPFVMVPPSDMHRHMGALLSSGVGTDIKFQVGEETFAAHRLVLGARSPVFMAQLFGPMKGKNTDKIVQVDDMEPRVFMAMLNFIYNDSLSDELNQGDDASVMAQHLLVAGDRYGLERLKLICERNLCRYIDTSTAATTLVLAEQHGCRGLKQACFEFLKAPGNLKTIMEGDEFQHLRTCCPLLLTELLANVAP